MEIDIFLKQSSFVKGVVDLEHLPIDVDSNNNLLQEIAFWGRSNVGKSSLINSIVKRKKLVKVSSTPGKTREINFFNLANSFYIVDLPGYGYARVSKTMQIVWHKVVLSYLSKGVNLKRLFLLIDARVGFKQIDLEIMNFLNTVGVSYQLIFTKCEKINKTVLNERQGEVKAIIAKNGACYQEAIFTSSKTKEGIVELQQTIVSVFKR